MQKLKELIKNEHALKCALELNQAGFIISIDTDHTNYFHFSNGKRVGYIQFEKYGAFSVSIQYLSTNCGSGASFIDRTYELPNNYKNFIDMANALFNYNPSWVRGYWRFYSDFKHYQTHINNQWNKERILIIQNDSFYTIEEYFIKGGE